MPNAQGYPLMLRVTESRKSRYLSLGVRCHPHEWDPATEQPTKRHVQRHEFSALINHKKQQVLSEIMAADLSGEMLSAKKIVDRVRKPKASQTATLFAFAQSQVEKLKAGAGSGSLRTSDIYGATIGVFRIFHKSDLLFSELAPSMLEQFESYYRLRGTRDTTISIHMSNLRRLYNLAIEAGLALEKDYPFKRYKISKLVKSTKKRALTKEDILTLINAPTPVGSPKRLA